MYSISHGSTDAPSTLDAPSILGVSSTFRTTSADSIAVLAAEMYYYTSTGSMSSTEVKLLRVTFVPAVPRSSTS